MMAVAEDERVAFVPGAFEGRGGNGLRIPARLVGRAQIAHTALGGLQVVTAGPEIAPGQTAYSAMICDGGAFHYFHLMESVIWLWSIQPEFLGGQPPSQVILSIAWDDPRQYGVGRALMAALYPQAEILDPNDSWPRMIGPTLILHRSWAQMRVNKYLEAVMSFGRPHALRLAAAIRHALCAYAGPAGRSNILYVIRPPPRCLEPALERTLLRSLGSLAACTPMDFAAVP